MSIRHNRREFLKKAGKGTLAAGMLTRFPGSLVSEQPFHNAPTSPNILIIFADQMRNRSWSKYDSFISTPNLARLASEGMTFRNCVSTQPVCTPFRAMLLTGRYPRHTGVIHNDFPLPSTETTIAHILKGLGYRTGYVGKWHLSSGREESPTRMYIPASMRSGFEDFWKAIEVRHRYRVNPPDPSYYDENNVKQSYSEYQSTGEANHVIEFMNDHRQHYPDDPFLMVWSACPPHPPYPEYPSSQSWYTQDINENFTDIPWIDNIPSAKRTQSNRNILGQSYSMISQLDSDVGKVLDELDKPEFAAIKSNTIIVYTSDHGDMLASQGESKKRKPWEESINTPFIIRYPGVITPNTTTEALMGAIDILPSLLGLGGLSASVPSNVDGKDLSFVMRGEPGEEYEAVFLTIPAFRPGASHDYPKWTGVRTKTVVYATFEDGVAGLNGGNGGFIMHDLTADPEELANLVDLPEHAAMQAQLWDTLQTLAEEAGELSYFNMPPRPTVTRVNRWRMY